MTAAAVAVADWGTTRLRLWTLDAAGAVVGEQRTDEGLLSARPDKFAAILERHLEALAAPPGVPVVICGMAGSRQGWVEAPYVSVPAPLTEVFDAAVRVASARRDVRILPGMAQLARGAPDVMRGEETQLAGAGLESGSHLVCMPGTHSKWVTVSGGRVEAFQTFMTGELFAVLAGSSILAHSLGSPAAAVAAGSPAFADACAAALADGDAAWTRLFRIRAATLLQDLAPADAAATLSGLLIGAEIGAALRRTAAASVVLVASGAMRALYEAALAAAGTPVRVVDADQAVRNGLGQAARHYGLIGKAGEAAA